MHDCIYINHTAGIHTTFSFRGTSVPYIVLDCHQFNVIVWEPLGDGKQFQLILSTTDVLIAVYRYLYVQMWCEIACSINFWFH